MANQKSSLVRRLKRIARFIPRRWSKSQTTTSNPSNKKLVNRLFLPFTHGSRLRKDFRDHMMHPTILFHCRPLRCKRHMKPRVKRLPRRLKTKNPKSWRLSYFLDECPQVIAPRRAPSAKKLSLSPTKGGDVPSGQSTLDEIDDTVLNRIATAQRKKQKIEKKEAPQTHTATISAEPSKKQHIHTLSLHNPLPLLLLFSLSVHQEYKLRHKSQLTTARHHQHPSHRRECTHARHHTTTHHTPHHTIMCARLQTPKSGFSHPSPTHLSLHTDSCTTAHGGAGGLGCWACIGASVACALSS